MKVIMENSGQELDFNNIMQTINLNNLKSKPVVKNEAEQTGRGEMKQGAIKRANTINNAKAEI